MDNMTAEVRAMAAIDGFELIAYRNNKRAHSIIFKIGNIELTVGSNFGFSNFRIEWRGRSFFKIASSQQLVLGEFEVIMPHFNDIEQLRTDIDELVRFKELYNSKYDRIKKLHDYLNATAMPWQS